MIKVKRRVKVGMVFKQKLSNQTIDYKKNSLQLVKYIAAFSVMWVHLINHYSINVPEWINTGISYFFGVPLFFSISGFTIWLSLEKNSDYKNYFSKRFFRIYPELWIGVLISIVSIVSLYSPVRNIQSVIILGLFAMTQGTFMQFWTPDALRGFGVGTPNGSLWTICVMIQFYIVTIMLYKFLRNKRIYWWFVLLLISVVSALIMPLLSGVLPEVVCKLYGQLLPVHFWMFWVGMFIAKYKTQLIPFLKRFWYLFLIANIILRILGLDLELTYPLFKSILLIAGMIGFAYAVPSIKISYDCTYGIYIYHMIIVNIFVHVGLQGQYWLIPVTIVATLIASITSTAAGNFIRKRFEKPSAPRGGKTNCV